MCILYFLLLNYTVLSGAGEVGGHFLHSQIFVPTLALLHSDDQSLVAVRVKAKVFPGQTDVPAGRVTLDGYGLWLLYLLCLIMLLKRPFGVGG
jgi:hypothetical protein